MDILLFTGELAKLAITGYLTYLTKKERVEKIYFFLV